MDTPRATASPTLAEQGSEQGPQGRPPCQYTAGQAVALQARADGGLVYKSHRTGPTTVWGTWVVTHCTVRAM